MRHIISNSGKYFHSYRSKGLINPLNYRFSSPPGPVDSPNLSQSPISGAPIPGPPLNAALNEQLQALERDQPFFDRLVSFDPDIMATLPGPLEFFDPVVEVGKDFFVYMHDSFHMPWWLVISSGCFLIRTAIMPLIYIQMKRTQKLAGIAPAIINLKKITDKSPLPKSKQWMLFAKATFQIVRDQNLKMTRLFLYNLLNIPLIITIVWSIRRLLVVESFQKTSFLWVPSLSNIDPYYIIPSMAIGVFYYNLQRFITPENQHTLVSRIRGIGQILLILWLPLLCNWPSAIAWYMLSNAVYSYIQTSMIINPKLLRYIEPQMLLYQFLLKVVEYDKSQSEAIVESIKSGEQSFKDKQIKEEVLVEQITVMLVKLQQDQKKSQNQFLQNFNYK